MLITGKTTDTHLSNVDFFRGAKIFLRVFGIWPLDEGPLPIRFYINFVSLFLAAIFGVTHGFVNLDNLFLALQSFCGCVFELISWCKLAALYYHRKKFTLLLKQLLKHYNKDYNKKEIAIYRKVIVYTTFAMTLLASGGLLTCTLYVFTPILTNLIYHFTGQPMVREQPFNAVYPFIDLYSDYFFLPCYIHLSHGGYCTAVIFNGIDSIFITACFHISAQFQIITMKIQNAFKYLGNEEASTATENRNIGKKLIEAIDEQNQLFDLTNLFIEVFAFIVLMHFTSVALIIGIGSIDLLMAPGLPDKALYLVYIVTVIIQSFAYAYSGHQICEHSLDIFTATWEENWYLLNVSNQKVISILLLRSQKAKYVKVPFFEVTLIAYTKIMSTAGSYITLLNKMLTQ